MSPQPPVLHQQAFLRIENFSPYGLTATQRVATGLAARLLSLKCLNSQRLRAYGTIKVLHLQGVECFGDNHLPLDEKEQRDYSELRRQPKAGLFCWSHSIIPQKKSFSFVVFLFVVDSCRFFRTVVQPCSAEEKRRPTLFFPSTKRTCGITKRMRFRLQNYVDIIE